MKLFFLILLPAVFIISTSVAKLTYQHIDQQLCALEISYVQGKTKISDDVYDGLISLRNQKRKNDIKPLNCSVATDYRNHHAYFMGSLRKITTSEQINSFIEQIKKQRSQCILQPKIDGLAVELIYRQGILIAASTRGNGYWGKDIYPLVILSRQIPGILHFDKNALQNTVILHGELYLRRDLVEKGKLKNYQQARHKVAGLAAQKKPDRTWAAWLDFYPWNWIDSPYLTVEQDVKQLSSWGFNFIQKQTHKVNSLHDIELWRQSYEQQSAKGSLLMDGVVIKANQKKLLAKDHEKELPDYTIAWKFPPKKAVVCVDNITWATGKTGKKTAILSFKPVILGGIRVTKVSAGGVKNMQKLNIQVGDIISIALKGQAIAVLDRVLIPV